MAADQLVPLCSVILVLKAVFTVTPSVEEAEYILRHCITSVQTALRTQIWDQT